MENGKERKPKEMKSFDPGLGDKEFTYTNRLALPKELKDYLKSIDMDFRFLNAAEFRAAGGYHRSQWQPFKAPADAVKQGLYGVTPEGLIQRGDLILGVRSKAITAQHSAHLAEKRKRYSNYGKTEAKRMREHIRSTGLSDHVRVEEGYGEDDGED